MTTKIESPTLAYDMLLKSNLESMNREITSNPSVINRMINEGETLLMAACAEKNKTAVRMLLALGADPNIKCPSHKGETPIYKTCTLSSPNNLAIAKMLIDNGARLDMKTDNEKYSPLHQACFCGRSAIATLLIENGANCNAMNQYNETPLHIALRYAHVTKDIALLMVKRGADMYTPVDIRGKRPIDYVRQSDVGDFTDAAPPTLTRHHSGSAKTPSKPPIMTMAPQASRPRSSSITSTPEKKQHSGKHFYRAATYHCCDACNLPCRSHPSHSSSSSLCRQPLGHHRCAVFFKVTITLLPLIDID
jgi:hypothetical protein